MQIKIYLADNVIAGELRFGNLEMLYSTIREYIQAVNADPSIEDLTVQICNSTTIHCTMHSYRSLISVSLDDLVNRPGIVNQLTMKILATMTPVIGRHLVSGKFVPVQNYGEYFNP